ncbi:ribose pyranase [Herbaspirillum rubrisubalbicans]|uniref:D-ribose pyranase n=1 Tax=Herbaspirillum rubrisubalbicans TaxID=80842 RepID=A0ABX9C7N9_9BURK|nr:D-ribose pyranase [Herbaspirillum rubrisubalbicans]NQE47090.1 ribose pyranase [Herbaspirillum rubrisubalbicans]RAM66955.1 ribose pyranase [Herbaspirillum rubrisubalbicans]RAN49181.1 ribose pyranase [Herbaspirillum rubrisubalbicans]
MKKTALLNAAISQVIATMGHGDTLVIGDVGLPAPAGVPVIDLAVTRGVPEFMTVLQTVLTELQVEFHVVADELQTVSPALSARIDALQLPQKRSLSHQDFKQATGRAKAYIRTGECTPYANIILGSGVVF